MASRSGAFALVTRPRDSYLTPPPSRGGAHPDLRTACGFTLSAEGVGEWTAFLQDDSRGESSFRPRDLDPLTSSPHTPLAPHQNRQKRQKHKKHKNRQKGRSEGTFSAPKATNLGLNRRFARHCQKVVTERSFCHRPSCIDGVPSKE